MAINKKTKPGNRIIKQNLLSPIGKFVLIISILAAIIAAVVTTLSEVRQLRQRDIETFAIRARLIESYINFYSRTVSALAHSMQQNMALPLIPEDNLKYLKDYSVYSIYGLSGFAQDGGQESRIGTLTGIGSVSSLNQSLRHEISAALLLDGQFAAQLEHSSELIWIYYTSSNYFIYMAPKLRIDDFHFQKTLYAKPFWSEAVPKVNPNLQVIVSSLYEDAAGQGLMITISKPVMLKDKFLGIVSLDMGINSLQNLLNVGQSQGQSILLSKDYILIAKKGDVKVGETINIPHSLKEGVPQAVSGKWLITKHLNNNSLILVHETDIKQVFIHAYKNTFHILIILFLVIIMEYLLLRLRKALGDVTLSMNTDPLTKLLNRRGFYSEIERIYSLSHRYPLKLSVLLLDIDHFKQVNDIFGHHQGDLLLEEIASQLSKELRTSDVSCRWGGEEFAILLPATSLSNAVCLAKRICRHIENNIKRPDGQAITVSIGVSEVPVKKSIEWALNCADKNLYNAKQTGRNRVCYDKC